MSEITTEKFIAPKIAKWLLYDVTKILNEKNLNWSDINPEIVPDLVWGEFFGLITSKTAKLLLKQSIETNELPSVICKKNNWYIIDNYDIILEIVNKTITNNLSLLNKYRSGNKNTRGAFLGAIYKEDNSHCFDMEILENVLDVQLELGEFDFE